MKKFVYLIFATITCFSCVSAQELAFPKTAVSDKSKLPTVMSELAKTVITNYKYQDRDEIYLNNLFRLQMVAGDYANAVQTINSYRKNYDAGNRHLPHLQFELFSNVEIKRRKSEDKVETLYRQLFKEAFSKLDNKTAFTVERQFSGNVKRFESHWQLLLDKQKDRDNIGLNDAIELCKAFNNYQVYKLIVPTSTTLLLEDNNIRYKIQDKVLIKTRDGASIFAIIVQPKEIIKPLPAVLFYTTYDQGAGDLSIPKESAANGYVGVLAYVRGVRTNINDYVPYENDGNDSYDVIDWISKQAWNNGKVGMFGGSYTGIVQWRTVKNIHPALKTIVPQVATAPGIDFPMENNVPLGFILRSANDHLKNDPLPQDLNQKWFETGKSYNSIDSLAGKPNRIFQNWLRHPDYDNYWKDLIPNKEEFRKINIPILTTTGYFDGAQKGALHYFREHLRTNKNAKHYLVIGPYDHFGSQRNPALNLYGYDIDPVANVSMHELVYQWLDYVLRDGKKPEILKDKINYEVMGANVWQHASSLEKMSNHTLTFYLSGIPKGKYNSLTLTKPSKSEFLKQTVDFSDRSTENNNFNPSIVTKELSITNDIMYLSEPFKESFTINGSFSGKFVVSINKKDIDVVAIFYEVLPTGEYFRLSRYVGRASYAHNSSMRKLLIPNKKESIPFEKTHLVSRQISKGSRLAVVINVNKHPYDIINYGSGKDVSSEDISDAGEPLKIKWFNDSFIKIPIWK